MSCHSNGDVLQPSCDTGGGGGGTSHQHQNCSGYGSAAAFVSGWMYVNEQGQMCGPYIQEQLYEGLSSGFLPDALPVYPIVNGSLINPVPLNYFKQFPDHITTGFLYLTATLSNIKGPTNSSTCSGGELSSNRKDAVPTTAYFNSQLASQPCINYNGSSSQQMPNIGAATLTMSYQPSVLSLPLLFNIIAYSIRLREGLLYPAQLYIYIYIVLHVNVILTFMILVSLVSLVNSLVKNHVGCLRMIRG